MFQKLTEVLTKLGETNLEIHSAFILQLGCVPLKTFKEPDSRFPVTDREKLLTSEKEQDKKTPLFYEEIIEVLKKHPNVFDIDIPDKEGSFVFMHKLETGILTGGYFFSLRVDLPERLQRYRFEYLLDRKPIENFNVISSGSCFAAFSPVQDYPILIHIGHEFRELLKEQIEKETSFSCPPLGPSPIHPKFYFIFRQKKDEAPPEEMKIYAHRDDIFLVLDKDSQTVIDIARSFVSEIQLLLIRFYAVMLHRHELYQYYQEIFNHFSELSNSVKNLFTTRWWKIYEAFKISYLGKRSLSNIHIRFVEFETTLFHFNTSRRECLEEINQHRILSIIHGYFTKTTDPHIQIPQGFLSAVSHFEGELRTFWNIRVVVIASLLGAAIGSILTFLFTQVF
jgi:hypothetical protein